MRKTLLLLLCTVIFWGCSSDDSGDSNTGTQSFNPPSWILGKWTIDENLSSGETGFEFKTNDFCYITAGVTTCFQSMRDAGLNVEVSEEKSDTHYKLNVTIQGTIYKYHFKKISNTVIQEVLTDPNGLVSYYRQNSNDEIALPVTFDFTSLSLPVGATSLEIANIEFRLGSSMTNTGWTNCVQSNNAVLEMGSFDGQNGIAVWGGGQDVLIADVSRLASIQKVIVNIASYGLTRISICDENGLIAEKNVDESQSGNLTVTLQVGGHKADKLYIACLEGAVYSVRIE